MLAFDRWDPLAVWLWLTVAQSAFWLLIGVGIARWLAVRPAYAHAVLLLAAVAAVVAPALSLVVQRFDWGVLEAAPATVMYRAHGEKVIVRALPGERTAWCLIAVWQAGAILLLSRLALAYLRGRRFVKSGEAVTNPALLDAAAQAAADLGLRRVPRLVRHSQATVPHLWGLGRLTVVLPDGPLPKGADLVAMFRHEFAHARRGDAITALFAEVVAAVLWWNPLAWVARKMLARSAEFACDDWALANEHRSASYAATLLALMPLRPAPRLMVSAAGDLFARIKRLTTGFRPTRPGVSRKWVIGIAVVIVVVIVGLGLFQVRSTRGSDAFGPIAGRTLK